MRLKSLHKKNLANAKKIIADSIKDHLIPQVSSLKTPKEMFDSLTKLVEGKKINRKMTLRKQLKNVKIQNVEQLEAIEEEVCRSGDSHLEWPLEIMRFIYVKNVCQK